MTLRSSLSGVGHALTDTFHQVGEQAKVVGSQLLETAKHRDHSWHHRLFNLVHDLGNQLIAHHAVATGN
ncbi:hypothetical protein FSP39_004900 [Pinctada imbricata]|uniref:Uncharacterized protein n=1 Tax=Pinctada imbricata TaxID=66713 RepID=A0AA88XZ27_PINIB|nr:hypothetical protein FSP39_004900 [Pinctada imbricata]